MVNVVGYIRVSTVNQVKEGYSLGEQLDEIEKYCAANGFNLIHTFSDEGKSGAKTDEDETKIDRDGLQNMLYMIKEGDIQYIELFSDLNISHALEVIQKNDFSLFFRQSTDSFQQQLRRDFLSCLLIARLCFFVLKIFVKSPQ